MIEYKYVINKEVLKNFFYAESITKEMISEVKKVIFVVMVKHFSYSVNSTVDKDLYNDLVQSAYLAILSRRDRYDNKYPAYNYIYTICRNEIGNNLVKLTRGYNIEKINNVRGSVVDPEDIELPAEINKYKNYLLGTEEFTSVRISKKSALDLIIFLRLHENKCTCKIPEFLDQSCKKQRVLYKLLMELFNE